VRSVRKHPREVQQVLPAGQVGIEVRRLHDAADARHRFREVVRDVEACNPDAAMVGTRETHEHPDCGGLARSVGTQETEHFSGHDLE
jgi:hypothetical protein